MRESVMHPPTRDGGAMQPRAPSAGVGGSIAAEDFSRDVYVPITTLWRRNGDMDNHFLGVELDTTYTPSWAANVSTNTIGREVIISEDVADITDTTLGDKARRLAHKEFANQDDSVLYMLESIANANGGLVSLNFASDNFTYNPDVSHKYFIDAKNKILFQANTGNATGNTARGTNFTRIKLQVTNGVSMDVGENRGEILTFSIWSNSRTDLLFNSVDENGSPKTYQMLPSLCPLDDWDTPVGIVTAETGLANINWTWSFGAGDGSIIQTGLYAGNHTSEGTGVYTSLNNLRLGRDPTFVPASIVMNDPDVLETMYNAITNAAPGEAAGNTNSEWYMPVGENGKAIPYEGNPTNFAFAIVNRNLTSSPKVFDFAVSTRVNTTGDDMDIPAHASGNGATYLRYLTKIIRNYGDNDGVILPHAYFPGTPNGTATNLFNPILSNKYVYMQYGTVENERRAKLAIGDTENEATINVNALPFWNYIQRSTLRATTKIISNMAKNGDETSVWVRFDPTIESPSYIPLDTFDIVLNEDPDNFSMTTYEVTSGSTNTATYGLFMISSDTGDTGGVFQTFGFGEMANLFIAVKNYTEDKVSIGIAPTISRAEEIANLADNADTDDFVTGESKYTWHRKSAIQNFGNIITALLTDYVSGNNVIRQTYVKGEGDTEVRAVDFRNYHSYDLWVDTSGDLSLTLESSDNNSSRTDIYKMSLAVDGLDLVGGTNVFYTLTGTGPANGEIVGIYMTPGASGILGTLETCMAPLWIAITGSPASTYGFYGVTDTDPIDGIDGLKALYAQTESLYNAEKASKDAPFYNTTVLGYMQTIGTLGSLNSHRIFNTTNYDSLSFNADGSTLTVVQRRGFEDKTLNYNVLWAGRNDSKYSFDIANSEMYYLVGMDEDSQNVAEYNHKFLIASIRTDANNITATVRDDVNTDTDYRFILSFADTYTEAANTYNSQLAVKDYQPFGYWTHEKLSGVNVPNTGVSAMQTLALPATLYLTDNGAVTGNLTSSNVAGLSFYADPRVFKSDTSETTRVMTNNNYPYGGYFDGEDTYIITFDDTAYNEAVLTHHLYPGSGVVTNTSGIAVSFKVLQYISDQRFVVQLVPNISSAGGLTNLTPSSTELANLFRNRVIAVDLGAQMSASDNIQLGYATAASPTTADMTTAIAAAIADLDARYTDKRQYTPNLTSSVMAFEQHRVSATMEGSGNYRKIFVNAYGYGTTNAGDFHYSASDGGDNQTITALTLQGVGTANNTNVLLTPSSGYQMKMSLKDPSIINPTSANTGADGNTTKVWSSYTIRPIKTLGKNTMVFKLHRPAVTTNTLCTTSEYWNNLVYNKYYSVVAGTGYDLTMQKIGVGDTADEAMNNAQSEPFYNFGGTYGGSIGRISIFDNVMTKRFTSDTATSNVVWAQTNIVDADAYMVYGTNNYQDIGLAMDGSVPALRNWRIFSVGSGDQKRYFAQVTDYSSTDSNNNDMIGYPMQYSIRVMYSYLYGDSSSQNGDGSLFTLSGMGPLDGYVIAERRTSATDQKMMLVPPSSELDTMEAWRILYNFVRSSEYGGDPLGSSNKPYLRSNFKANIKATKNDNMYSKVLMDGTIVE